MHTSHGSAGLVIFGVLTVVAAPVMARDNDQYVRIEAPDVYQPSFEQGGYHNQPEGEQERESRRQRAMDWRAHRGRDNVGSRGSERDGERTPARGRDRRNQRDYDGQRSRDDMQR